MDKFIAFYYLIILLLVVFMPNVFYVFGLILIIIQIEIKNRLSHHYHACIFCSVYMQLPSKPFRGFSFFLSKPLLLRWSLFIRLKRVQIFNSLERFKAIYPCYLFIIRSESHFLPSGKFQRPKMFTSDIFSDSEIKVIPESII